MTEQIQQLKKIIDESNNIVFFGGAGVSTESGIPDFRSVDGLYNQKYDYPPETILSHTFYRRKTEEFYRFYRDKMICLAARPNAVHLKLAQWETEGKLKAVVTQNIDGLHQMAGSKKVLELHGSVLRNYCENCGKFYDAEFILHSEGVPKCECGGGIKPDVVKIRMKDIALAYGGEYGADKGIGLHADSEKVASFVAIPYYYEDLDGNAWENPLYESWLALYKG